VLVESNGTEERDGVVPLEVDYYDFFLVSIDGFAATADCGGCGSEGFAVGGGKVSFGPLDSSTVGSVV
jgi:hypothetical protein